MITVNWKRAMVQFPQLLKRVTSGERVLITKNGVPIAELAPVNHVTAESRQEAIEQLRSFHKGRFAGMPLKKMIEEGRR